MARVTGAILGGGGATRFGGRPKGLERVGGVRILDRLVDVFGEALGAAPLLVANAPEAPAWRPDLRVVADLRASLIPGSIYTAWSGRRPRSLRRWDVPFVAPLPTAGLAAGLAGGMPSSRNDSRRSTGRSAPRTAQRARRVAASLSRRPAGDRFSAIRAGRLPLDAVRRFGDPARLFFNVNTADDLARADAL